MLVGLIQKHMETTSTYTLGHANPNVTLSIYSHTLQIADKEAANIMENLMIQNNNKDASKKVNT